MLGDDLFYLIDILEYSVKVGRQDATRSPQMLEAVFDNLQLRCSRVRSQIVLSLEAEQRDR